MIADFLADPVNGRLGPLLGRIHSPSYLVTRGFHATLCGFGKIMPCRREVLFEATGVIYHTGGAIGQSMSIIRR